MARVVAFQNTTLDGVMQAPGRGEEDPRGDFRHGGWSAGFQDETSMEFAAEALANPGALLFGRRTYEDILGFWTLAAESNPFTEVLVNTPKYVVSSSEQTRMRWPNSKLLAGDPIPHVAALRERNGPTMTVMGSGALTRTLHRAGLVDEYVLQIHPITLGSGTRLFGPADRTDLDLVRSIVTTTGVIIAQYRVQR